MYEVDKMFGRCLEEELSLSITDCIGMVTVD
jgi:hypothetical protein